MWRKMSTQIYWSYKQRNWRYWQSRKRSWIAPKAILWSFGSWLSNAAIQFYVQVRLCELSLYLKLQGLRLIWYHEIATSLMKKAYKAIKEYIYGRPLTLLCNLVLIVRCNGFRLVLTILLVTILLIAPGKVLIIHQLNAAIY